MQAYEVLEPSIRTVLRTFLAKFKAPEFTRGLVSIGNALLDIFTVIGNIGAWVTRNFHWIDPLVFTGVVATRLFKVAGALTNIGIAWGLSANSLRPRHQSVPCRGCWGRVVSVRFRLPEAGHRVGHAVRRRGGTGSDGTAP